MAAPSFPVTSKVPLVTLIVSSDITPKLESAERVSAPTPLSITVEAPGMLKGAANVLPAVDEFRFNIVLLEIVILPPLTILNAPPEVMVSASVTVLPELPVMVAPMGRIVVP